MYRNPENTYCGLFDSHTKKTWSHRTEERTVEYYELEIFSEASGISHIDGKEFPVRRGMLLCAKPGQIRFSDLPIRCNFIRIKPGEEELDRILASLPDVFYLDNSEVYENILGNMKKLAACMIGGNTDDTVLLRINSLLYEIIYRCMREVNGKNALLQSDPQNRIIAEAYGYIDENYTSACSLYDIASCVHISPNYLHTLFKRVTGITPFEYVTKKRIDRAKRLIMAGELTLLEIALSCGFCSQSHFNKVFKERTGETPAEYRRGLWEKY